MKDLIYSCNLFLSPLFFAIISIFGVSYSGSVDSSLYVAVSVIFFSITIFTFILENIKSRIISIKAIISISILSLISFSGYFYGDTNSSMFSQFVVLCIPTSLAGIWYGNKGSIEYFIKWIDIFILIVSFSFFFTIPQLLSNIATQTSHYSQTMSYNASFVLVLNLYMIGFGSRYNRFRLFNSTLFKLLSYAILPLQFTAMILGGGRGAIFTLFTGLLLYFFFNSKPLSKVVKTIFVLILVLFLLLYISNIYLDIDFLDVFYRNAGRAWSFFDSNLSSFDRTSGRDSLYIKTIELIKSRPILGYGLFNYKLYISPHPYPHNIVLEWGLQGGIIFMLLCILIASALLFKMIKIITLYPKNILLLALAIYPFTSLLFSGSYLQSPLFWFIIMFLFNYKLHINNDLKNRVT